MTILNEELERMKAELAAQEGKENEEIVEELKEESNEEAAETKEEPEKEEIKEEKPEEKKPEIDDAGFARLRREATAEKRRAEAAEKELAELRKAKEVVELPVEAPLHPEMQTVLEDHRINRAEREFSMFESKVKQQHPEYGAIATEYANAMAQAFRIQNPRKTDVEINDMTKRAILIKAGEFARAGYENPVEEMYHEAKELGFTGKSFQKQESSKEEKLEPDMKKVAENRKRSSGMAASHGRQEGLMTLNAAADLTAAEWSKLPKADKQRLLYGR